MSAKPEALTIAVGGTEFTARLEWDLAPQSCAAFLAQTPFQNKLIHSRWSGEACWIPLGDLEFGVGVENATSYPAPGEILLYPGKFSETEILFPYGACCFASPSSAWRICGPSAASRMRNGRGKLDAITGDFDCLAFSIRGRYAAR